MIFFEMKTYVISSWGFLRSCLEPFTCSSFQTTIRQGQAGWGSQQPGQAGVSAHGSGAGTK